MDEALTAGWYRDPLNAAQSRWWDGREWTQLTQAATDSTVVLPGVPSAVQAPAPGGAPAPGWYPDPGHAPVQRFWDGSGWTSQVAPAGPPYSGGTTVIVNGHAPKSVGVAFLLTLIFGPLGVLYSSVTGGVVMILVSFFGGLLFGLVTFGFGLVLWLPMVWVASMIWGCVAAGSSNTTTIINR